MPITRRDVLKNLALAMPAMQMTPRFNTSNHRHADAPFEATRASLRKYQIPDWFRNAKFGIWAHWGPQSAVEAGDWYARRMYIEGDKSYDHHLKTYGHPSQFGFKDTIPAWKAEKFDPDYLLGLYKKAGARYFMTMGVHHDNFDLWNSKHNAWNAVKMGPKKDIVGMFKQAAMKHGLKFGISDHLWITYKWFSSSKGADRSGRYKGVKYDGADPKNFNYYGDCEEVFDHSLDWNENGIPERWKKHWYDRISDLVTNYEPDLLYCDGHLPFEEYGLRLLAMHYNQNAKKHGGVTQAVYTSKRAEDSAEHTGICVYDVERGVVENIWPLPWQTDTCIGEWHYNREVVNNYKSVKTVIDLLVDIVSRNGNLMLNFPLPASGMPDDNELKILDGITKWMSVNSEAIYDTKPWKVFGETNRKLESKNDQDGKPSFNEEGRKDLDASDIRFTTKGNTLYAFAMGKPQENTISIKSLSGSAGAGIQSIELLGAGKVRFESSGDSLKIMLPERYEGEHALAFKIIGAG
jgi:alpha-L-fucosidase